MCTLYVGNLIPNTTKDELNKIFTFYGPVSSISICTENNFGHPHCYAFVEFLKLNDANFALKTLNLKFGVNGPIRITWYKPEAGKVFIQNLDKRIDNEALYKEFAAFGNILDCKVANYLGVSVKRAYVHFETEEAADACIRIYDQFKLRDEVIYVEKYNLWQENEKGLNVEEKTKILFKMVNRNSIFESNKIFETIIAIRSKRRRN